MINNPKAAIKKQGNKQKNIFKSAQMFYKNYQILTDWEMSSRSEVPQVFMDTLD